MQFVFSRFYWICLLLMICSALGNGYLHPLYAQAVAGEAGSPREYQIGAIDIVGVQYADETTLIHISGLKVGKKIRIPGDELGNAIENIWKQGLFSDVQIYATNIVGDAVNLEIKLTERPRLSKYTFEGLRKAEEEDLTDKISLIRGRIVNDDLLAQTRTIISRHFRDKGFLNTTVKFKQESDPQFTNSVILTIDVQRNQRVRIANIQFAGNDNATSRKLKKQMSDTKEQTRINPRGPRNLVRDAIHANIPKTLGNLSWAQTLQYIDENFFRFKLFSSSKFIPEKYEADKDKVIAYYNSLGYRDARIAYDTVLFETAKHVNVNITVNEGPRYYFRDIEWKGNTKYPDEALGKLLGIEKGDVYNKELLDRRLHIDPNGNDISSLYMDDGYLFFNVRAEEKSVENDSIDLVINIYEGAQATINKIIIKGNDKTNEHVIRRELRSIPGSKFSRSDIIRSQREIANLGHFDPEKIQINPKPNPSDGTVDIEYIVEERSGDQIELQAGWGGNTIIGTVGLKLNNFSARNIFKPSAWRPLPSGDGQQLAFRVQSTGKAYQALTVSFAEPWLGGKRPNLFAVSLFGTRSFLNSLTTDINSKDAQTLFILGADVSLSRRLRWPDDNFVLKNGAVYQRYILQNWQRDFILVNGAANNLNFSTTIGRYSVDQPIFPRTGSNIELTVSVTPPYSLLNNKNYAQLSIEEKYKWVEYHKWKFKAEWFIPVGNKLVLKTTAKMGAMGYFNRDIGYSPFERFEIGGDGMTNYSIYGKDVISLRGYETLTSNSVKRSDGGNVFVGDPFFAKYNLELRFPISLNPSTTIYALSFLEAGNSWSNFTEYNPFNLYRSGGLGVRFFLPMFGLLGFDYGVGFDKIETQKSTSFGKYLSNHGKFSFMLGVEVE